MLRRTLLTALLAALALPAVACARGFQSYGMYGDSAVSGTKTSVYRASFVLPDSWRRIGPRDFAARARLRFGPVGSCRSQITITGRNVLADADQTASEHAAQVLDVPRVNVYGTSVRGRQASRVVRRPGTSNVSALMTVKSLRQEGTPVGKAVWTEILAQSTAGRDCHTGGIREAIGFVLADAFAGGRVSGY